MSNDKTVWHLQVMNEEVGSPAGGQDVLSAGWPPACRRKRGRRASASASRQPTSRAQGQMSIMSTMMASTAKSRLSVTLMS